MEKITQLDKKLILLIFVALASWQGFSQSQQFDANGNFIVPAGVTSVTVEAWGGGGHGGNRTLSGRAGGGGGGAYASSVIAVTPGQSIPITVGQGSDDDSPGGDSWFQNASTVMAKGGNSGPNNGSTSGSGGSATSSVGTTKYAGGNGAGATASISGGGGSSAASTAAGTTATSQTGANAPGDGGDGGDGRSNGGNGTDGSAPGGGGGGGYKSGSSNRIGGNGGNGRVIVTYVIQDINITGNSINIVSGDITPSTTDFTDFGSVFASSGTIVRNFSIQNTGTAALTGVTVSISGANASDFTLTTSPSPNIAAAGNSTFTITFDPSALGSRTATVSVASNDPDENPYTFAVQGMGTTVVDMSVSGNAVNIADGDTTPSTTDNTNFGACDITTGSVTKTFVVTNNGTYANTLSITGITFTGTGNTEFSVSPASADIAGGSSVTFTVTFNPVVATTRYIVMNFATNDPDNNPYNFNLTGVGADPNISLQGNGVTIPDNDTTPSAADGTSMGSVAINGSSISQTFYIQNLTGAGIDLTIAGITSSNSQFTVTTMPAATIPIGGSTPFVITFDPTSTGTKTSTITISSNDYNSAYIFTVSGVGTDAEIDVTGNGNSISDGDTTPSATDNTNFGTTPLQSGFITRTFTITNSASATAVLNLGTLTVSGANASDFTLTQPAATTLAAGANTTFTVTFDPTASGTRTATINIPNNDSNESSYDFAVSGFGNDPDMEVLGNGVPILDASTATSVLDNTDFGSVSMQGGSAIANYTITNNGAGTMTIGAISFTGTGAAFFSVATAPSATLAQGASTTFQISFTPTSIGTKTATIYITSDDYDENPYNFNLTGLGVRTYPDTDNDGIADNVDIDDDNDGIIDTQEQSNCVQSVYSNTTEHTFLNETFGAGTTKGQININIPGATCTYCYEDGIVQANTTACPSQSSAILDDGEYVVTHRIANTTVGHPDNIHYDLAWNGLEDHTTGDTYGRMAVFNASYAPGVFYETTISGIMPNVPITYSFWALNIMSQGYYSGSIKPNITVEFLDMSNNILSTYNTGDLGRCTGGVSDNTCAMSEWLQFTTSVNLGTVTSFIIRFRNNAPGGGGNDLAIDDITIKQQYCDRDGDGIANIFDLDADNDGLPDIEEAGFGSLSGGRAKMDLATAGVWVDANANGLHDTIDAMISGGTYVLPDTDGDGTRNFQDLDSDNDSLFDVDEAGLANGDGDVDGDALGDNADADLDGVLDIFDTFVGYGTQVRPFAANTDNIGNPDYMQLDSNNDGIRDIDTGLFASLDANTDGKIDGTADADKDGIMDTLDTAPNALGSPRNLERKLYIDFDGRNDYGEGSQVLSGLAQSTIMGWIKLAPGYNTEGIVFGQDNFYIRISATGIARAIAKTATLSYTAAPLAANRWYHVAAVYNGAAATEKLKLFINGAQVTQSSLGSLAGTLNASTNKFTIAKYAVPGSATPMYFNGSIEEVRAFNTALTNDQLQKMVYQEIKQNGSSICGEFVPKDVELTSWSSLVAYYRMDNFKDDVIDDHITTAIDAGTATTLARIYNVKNIRVQLAPMPFVTSQSSSIDTAVSQNNYVNGADVTTYPWSIVHVKHNLNLSANQTCLGMKIDPGLTVNVNNDNKLENSWWLKLDGKLDLQGKSQLVQTANSDLDPTSSGYIEKDQQGTTNKFNYNYWSSPVGAINAATNNNNFTVNGVLKDGTNAASPANLNWTTGYDSAATSPITLSSAWIYKFQNTSNNYANWAYVGQNGSLMAAQGFTLKGSSALTESQNYTFVGKPNNGVITLPIAANMLNLTGNPYPSAMDADAFITDNLSVINGAIHFWEHFGTNNSHITANYQGGYATYTLVGGTPPVAHPDGSGLGSSTKTPKRYIPVGQGFFVTATATGGNITFRNSQRAFIKEDNTLSYSLFKTTPVTSIVPTVQVPNNADDIVPASQAYGKIRIGYDYSNGLHRQLLIGFMNELATPGFDLGYDADNYDSNPDELVFLIGTHKAIIQGDGYFNVNSSYPLEVKAAAAGTVKFRLDATENFDNDQPIYIYDKTTGIYHNLRDENFSLSLPAGTYSDRFFLRFVPEVSTTIQKDVAIEGIDAAYDIQSSELGIRNQLEDVTVYKATLVNMLGQVLEGYTVEGQDQTNIRIPVKSLSAGTYIVKIETTGGTMSQKVVIK